MFSLTRFCFLLYQFCAFVIVTISSAKDTLSPSESITDGETLVSAGNNFALGFFSPSTSPNRYVGIWYNKISEKTVAWVANRDNPLNDSSGILSLAFDGNLIVSSGSDQRHSLWSTNVSIAINTTFLRLLNTGNLVLYDRAGGGNTSRILWQSFDHPTHMWLPGLKLGLDRTTGLNRILTSWKSQDDPGQGIYSYGIDPRGYPQFFMKKQSKPFWRPGSWNGRQLTGVPHMTQNYVFRYDFVETTDELYMIYTPYNSSTLTTVVVDFSGTLQRRTWVPMSSQWNTFFSAPTEPCDDYGHCGPYGTCSMQNTVECSCLPSFQPKSPTNWDLREWLDGCERQRSLGCGKGDGFLKLRGMKLPDTSMALVDMNLSLKECEQGCSKNCSCTAYATANITGEGSGCLSWFGSLMDIKYFSDSGQDFYLRVDAVELAAQARKDKGLLHNRTNKVILSMALIVGMLLSAWCAYYLMKKKKAIERRWQKRQSRLSFDFTTSSANELADNETNPELPFIELDVVAAATDNFSPNNKLGEGGFGAVYKGRLFNGKEIAVKRLSKNSGQGTEEFKNEVQLIAKLQHRNLVRLQACCAQEEEKILIYEYMPNKSLDSFIFDESKRELLKWRKRFEIIIGIARGVLYLHQDSRLRIIHRDLKVSNVLLDEYMNPRISDFGMARIFGGDQIQANTNKVVGTYGYMSPEYAMQGLFSIKSDVFSFGVLLLEIISGKKNTMLYFHEDPSISLIEHVWELWKEGRALEIVDSSMVDSLPSNEVLKCIHIGLLCVQESASDRPTMSSVVFMLGEETKMPAPNQPAFILKRTLEGQQSSTRETGSSSINEVTISVVDPR